MSLQPEALERFTNIFSIGEDVKIVSPLHTQHNHVTKKMSHVRIVGGKVIRVTHVVKKRNHPPMTLSLAQIVNQMNMVPLIPTALALYK